jgi:hypothetical protein
MKRCLIAVAIFCWTAAIPAAAQTQQPPASAPPQVPDASGTRPIGAGELQQLFDAWTMSRAQEALQLSEAQYGRFVTRLKALQDVRRRHMQARNKVLANLRRLTNPQTSGTDEALTAGIKALRDEDEHAAADIRQAYDGVDETLDPHQQARFRLFEERMEQQKLELLMRARQNARAAARGRGRL